MSKLNRVIEIRKALLDLGVTQADMARELGVTRAYVCGVIKGGYGFRGKRSDRIRQAIAERVGRTVDELWGPDVPENNEGQKSTDAPTDGEGESCQGAVLPGPFAVE